MFSAKEKNFPEVRICTNFSTFRPPVDFARSVRRLLHSVPSKYLTGLDCVILRDSGGLTTEEKKKSGADSGTSPRGAYYRGNGGTPPRIHLFIDNMAQWSKRPLQLPVMRDFIIAKTLFHELGHHIQNRIEPRHKSHEAAAKEWARELTRSFLRKKYWYWVPIMKLVGGMGRLFRRR
jgi:hypothetical protein